MLEILLGVAAPSSATPAPPNVKPRRDEGNFEQSEKLLATIGQVGKGSVEMNEIEVLAARMRYLLAPLATADPRKLDGGFAATYYAPYFAEIARRDYVEPMTYHVFQSTPKEGLGDWLRANATAVSAFLTWSKSYAWRDRRP
jgi:hypothetical protein